MNLYDSITIIKNFFRITFVTNNGGAWSILSGNIIFLIIFSLLALVAIYIFMIKDKKTSKLELISYGFLFGGIIGNLIDRIFRKSVIDYLDFNFGNYNFPVFNFADIAIVCSVILLVVIHWKDEKNA